MNGSLYRVQAPCRTDPVRLLVLPRKTRTAGDAGCRPSPAGKSHFLDLREVELDRGRAAEDRHGDADLRLVVVDVFHRAVEVGERAFLDSDRLAHFPLHLRAGL